MAKYRKLPVVIEAFQYDGYSKGSDDEYYVPDWAVEAQLNGTMYYDSTDDNSPPCELFIKTLEGNHHVSVGDYIIRGIKGELYPCKPDIFEKTYELVEASEKFLYSFFWDCGRSGEVSGVFKAKPIEVENLIGRSVYFGEILGKHSEVFGTIEEDEIKLESDDPMVVRAAIESGYNPLKYCTCSKCGRLLDLERPAADENVCGDCLAKQKST